jgi:hypothetical protein
MTEPTIEVGVDFDGYFEGLVRNWVLEKAQSGRPFHHRTITVNAGPYRPYAVRYSKDGDTIHLDFYSALRTGFGELSEADVEGIKELL